MYIGAICKYIKTRTFYHLELQTLETCCISFAIPHNLFDDIS